MAIEVIKEGASTIECPTCFSTLKYEKEDIKLKDIPGVVNLESTIRYIPCPHCNCNIILDKLWQ